MFKIFLGILLLGGNNLSCSPESFSQMSGKVIKIVDGDTYDLLLKNNTTIRIRMAGIDAPEKGMPFYKVAKDYLGKLCFGKQIHLEIIEKDRYGRYIAYSFLENRTELSHEMIKGGMAWHFKKYSSDAVLSSLEIAARKSKLGLWADENPMPPWENRRMHKKSTRIFANKNDSSLSSESVAR